jgi:hypothetical protein
MSSMTTNALDERSHEMSDIRERLTSYFSGREEVSSVFIKDAGPKAGSEVSVAILVKDAGLSETCLRILEDYYTREASARELGIVQVEVLNISPAAHQYRILKDWTLAFERNRSFRTWFFEHATIARNMMAMAA